jgi:adenosylmethionine-8-amino-7-oxononanoate aminotransferase
MDELLAPLAAHPLVADVRRAGLMAGIEITAPAQAVASELYARGQFTRPIGQTVQLVPPLSSTRAEIASFVAALAGALDAVA